MGQPPQGPSGPRGQWVDENGDVWEPDGDGGWMYLGNVHDDAPGRADPRPVSWRIEDAADAARSVMGMIVGAVFFIAFIALVLAILV
ncbi:hypothetical protein ACIBI4_15495 [Streptomyces sp. NPDC050418]|uniref:hypothetical protein n=1 Tax=Streptomyces sp. NPDC050418 TaxID=3365612 RepID=UPI00379E2DA2